MFCLLLSSELQISFTEEIVLNRQTFYFTVKLAYAFECLSVRLTQTHKRRTFAHTLTLSTQTDNRLYAQTFAYISLSRRRFAQTHKRRTFAHTHILSAQTPTVFTHTHTLAHVSDSRLQSTVNILEAALLYNSRCNT